VSIRARIEAGEAGRVGAEGAGVGKFGELVEPFHRKGLGAREAGRDAALPELLQRFVQVFAALRVGDERAPGATETPRQLLSEPPSGLIAIGRQDEALDLLQPGPVIRDVAIFLIVLRLYVVGAFGHRDEVALFVTSGRRAIRH
jgi:hypothetical protein